MYLSILTHPIGTFYICADDTAVISLTTKKPAQNDGGNNISRQAAQQLSEYLSGQRTQFTLPLSPNGTAFQRAVRQQLLAIPYGGTCSYQQIASALGKPEAVRAVGRAIGQNPIWIVIPCHRVIGKDGSLTGYAGGLSMKKALLELEQHTTVI